MLATCPRCATPLPEAARFCPSCGVSRVVASVTSSQTPTVASDDSRVFTTSQAAPGRRSRFVAGELVAGRYRVEGLLGKGGMGEVYRAEDVKLGHPVALKFLPVALAQNPSMLARFHNEVRLARQVTHPNVCRVHDIGEVDGQPYLTMEYVDGENLASLLRRIGRLPRDKAIQIARQLCAGLSSAHDKGVLHRDLKPENVMLDGTGTVRIMDFGLAGFREELAPSDLRSGTPAYMAPEQLEGRDVTVRSDLYALGVTLYELFTGKPVFEAKSLAELEELRASHDVTRPSDVLADIDPAVERVILRCLERDPADRPVSALAVAMALPGGDPLRAALAAGETPSPEMVAAAGGTGVLRASWAWGLVAFIVAAFVISDLALRPRTIFGWVDLDRPPEAMAERGRQALVAAGYEAAPVERAWAFGAGTTALEWLKARPESDRFAALRSGRYGAVTFWYREAPRELTPGNVFGRVVPDDPPPEHLSGDGVVFFDEAGRVQYLQVTPPQQAPEAPPAAAPAWSKLFAAAGLDPAAFREVPPAWTPPVWSDHRVAWAGTIPEYFGSEVRVEAASAFGKVVYFDLVKPWDRPTRTAPREPTAQERLAGTVNAVLLFFGVIAAALVAWRNVASGRADRRGASRLAIWGFVVTLGQWACFANHQTRAVAEWNFFTRASGFSLFIGTLAALLYLALEPIVRKGWPDALISWTRLLSGRLRDPLVARDALVGVAVSAAVTALVAAPLAIQGTASPAFAPAVVDLDGTLGLRGWIGQMLAVQINSLISPLLILLLFAGLKQWLKTTGRAVVAMLVVLGPIVVLAASRNGGWVAGALGLIQLGIMIGVLVRFGLLATVVSSLVGQMGNNFPFFTDTGRWYSPYGAAAFAVVLALAAWGAWQASRGRVEPWEVPG
jgi:serine/threonine-protein kinase